MVFTKEVFYKRIYKEVRRKSRHVERCEWNYYDHANLGLVAEEVLRVYTGRPSDFDDLMHFYFQTIRIEVESDEGNWKALLEQNYRDHQLVTSRELRDRPWKLTPLDAETYTGLCERISAALPDTAVSGGYCEGILIGDTSWEGTHVLARFDSILIRIDLANLA